MKIIHLISCCLLSALCVVESAGINVTGVVGRQVKINCSYSWAEDNDKYFCKESCSKNDILIQSDGKQNYKNKDRFSILNTINGVFTVTITKLEKSDSGKYWCGVNRLLKDTYTEVHLKVTDAPPTSTPSPVTSRPHVSTTLPNLSTTLPNLSTTSSNLFTTFLASGDISGHSSSRAGLMVWTSAGLVVMVTVLGLVLLLFYRQRRGTRRTPPPPVSSNTQPDPAGEVDCVYEEIREADRQTDTLPLVISSVYSTVNSPTTYSTGQASTTYPADQASTTYPADQAIGVPHCDIYANASCHKDDINPSYSTADHPDSLIYSSVDLPTDSRVSSSPPTVSGTQDDSIYSTAQLPKDTVESTRYPAVHLPKDTPKDVLYSTAQLPKDTVESTRDPAVHLSKDTPEDALYSTAQLPKDTVESTRDPAVHLSKDTPEDALYSTAQLPKDTVESRRYPAVHLSKDTPEDALYSTAQLPKIM
ncbi:CMRF35-like molecule 1 [Oncorhynchus kisutch]|uniref:CMRF35-like molecule 1 n=1 Tax=Oncorhynchus kisutch TaxID=8019 RepID=A0A8C7MYT5_ONCKI|nr:CMRF35-like molecule 1 [Oncorhynchus kisutch]